MNCIKIILLSLFLVPFFSIAQIAIKGGIVYTVSSTLIRDGVVLIRDGKIEQVGPASSVSIPTAYKVYSAKVVTPGLIDARTVVGLAGALNIPTDQDQLEKSSPIQPDLRAIDAYNPDESLVKVLRENGVTTIHTGHGIGALVSGQTMVAKTKAGTVETVTLQPLSMIAMTLGAPVSGNFPSPGTRAKQMAMIRTELIKAQAYAKKQSDKDSTKRPSADLRLDGLVKLLRRETKALITANTLDDIMNAIRLQKEFDLKLVIDGAAEAYRAIDEIKGAKAEVILHPTMARHGGSMVNMTRESAGILTAAGIPVSIESGYESYVPKTRLILGEAAVAIPFGLSFDDALRSITINPAKLLGLDNRIGTLEKGKDADLVMYDGDPFEFLTKVCTVIIDGVVVSDRCQEK